MKTVSSVILGAFFAMLLTPAARADCVSAVRSENPKGCTFYDSGGAGSISRDPYDYRNCRCPKEPGLQKTDFEAEEQVPEQTEI